MSGSQSKRNHRREARTRAEAPKNFMHALLRSASGELLPLLTRTYHGGRLPGSNGAVGFTGITFALACHSGTVPGDDRLTCDSSGPFLTKKQIQPRVQPIQGGALTLLRHAPARTIVLCKSSA